MKAPDQPSSLAVGTEDTEGTEDEDIIADQEITVETRIAMTIRNTPPLTANWTITLPKTVTFLNDSTAKKRNYAITVENPVIYGPIAKHTNMASKLETGSTNKASRTQSQIRRHPSQRQLHL
jgi:hypothetical protein